MYLILKASILVKTSASLERYIGGQVRRGCLDRHPEALMSFIANSIKENSKLEPLKELVGRVVRTVEGKQLSEGEMNEWCNLVVRLSQFNYVTEEMVRVERLQKKAGRASYYYVHYCLIMGREVSAQQLRQMRAFDLVRVYGLLVQSAVDARLQGEVRQLIMEQPNFIYSQFSEVDYGLLSMSLFNASLDDDKALLRFLVQKYSKEISQLVDSLKRKQLRRDKTGNRGQLAASVGFMNAIQLYQACIFGGGLLDVTADLEEGLAGLQIYDKQSQFEREVEHELRRLKVEYVREYDRMKPFMVDFFLPQSSVVLECNGHQHYLWGKLRKSDQLRNQHIQHKYGLRVKILTAHDWNHDKTSL